MTNSIIRADSSPDLKKSKGNVMVQRSEGKFQVSIEWEELEPWEVEEKVRDIAEFAYKSISREK